MGRRFTKVFETVELDGGQFITIGCEGWHIKARDPASESFYFLQSLCPVCAILYRCPMTIELFLTPKNFKCI